MATRVEGRHGSGTWVRAMARWRRVAWVIILIADVGLLAWAAMAALAPQRLAGPGGTPILTAGYEGFTGGSWQDLVATSPKTAEYTTLLFRMYGIYGMGLSLLAIAIAAEGFRHRERWAWWALLVGNTIGYGRRWCTTRSWERSGRSSCRNISASLRSTGPSPSRLLSARPRELSQHGSTLTPAWPGTVYRPAEVELDRL
jgi:hypothetical protein